MITETPQHLKPETLANLRGLQRANRDAAAALKAASSQAESTQGGQPLLHRLFDQIGSLREDFANELGEHLASNDEAQSEGVSPSGRLRELWVNFRAAINAGEPHVLLIEARRSEANLDEAYREAILATTGSPVNDVLHRQLADVVETRKALEAMEALAA